jgi:hypothetical protein
VRSQERFLEIAAQNTARRLTEVPAPAPYADGQPAVPRRERQAGAYTGAT